jgi:hypothetical protein
MTPEEKAQELFDIYKKQVSMTIKDYNLICKVLDADMAKQCALIAIDLLIESTPSVNIYPPNFQQITPKVKEYWVKVQKEIEVL